MVDGVVGAVKVKPLVWIGEDGDEYAEALGFRYLLCDPSSSDECRGWYVLEDTTNTVIGKNDGCPLAAKAAAQADYESRIMAALDVQPVTVQDAARVPEVQALIEAAKRSAEGWDNAIDLKIIHARHVTSAGILRDEMTDAMRAISDTD